MVYLAALAPQSLLDGAQSDWRSGFAARADGVVDKAAATMGLRRVPAVKIVPLALGPMVSGLFRPLIILPQNFTEKFNADEQYFALCHEMAHIKRRDLWAALALLIFRAVHWYNPLVHYAVRRFQFDQEAACDHYLLSKLDAAGVDTDLSRQYGETLLKAERHAAPRQTAALNLS